MRAEANSARAFVHSALGKEGVIGSFCPACKSLVAAAKDLTLLRFAEMLHECPNTAASH